MRKIGKELFSFQKLMKMWLWGGGYSITNFTTVLLLFLTKKEVGKKFCLTKHFSGRIYLHMAKPVFELLDIPFFTPIAHRE
jgi:hypothetical protein